MISMRSFALAAVGSSSYDFGAREEFAGENICRLQRYYDAFELTLAASPDGHVSRADGSHGPTWRGALRAHQGSVLGTLAGTVRNWQIKLGAVIRREFRQGR
jgi:hypothetical protein